LFSFEELPPYIEQYGKFCAFVPGVSLWSHYYY